MAGDRARQRLAAIGVRISLQHPGGQLALWGGFWRSCQVCRCWACGGRCWLLCCWPLCCQLLCPQHSRRWSSCPLLRVGLSAGAGAPQLLMVQRQRPIAGGCRAICVVIITAAAWGPLGLLGSSSGLLVAVGQQLGGQQQQGRPLLLGPAHAQSAPHPLPKQQLASGQAARRQPGGAAGQQEQCGVAATRQRRRRRVVGHTGQSGRRAAEGARAVCAAACGACAGGLLPRRVLLVTAVLLLSLLRLLGRGARQECLQLRCTRLQLQQLLILRLHLLWHLLLLVVLALLLLLPLSQRPTEAVVQALAQHGSRQLLVVAQRLQLLQRVAARCLHVRYPLPEAARHQRHLSLQQLRAAQSRGLN
jgi:hypothetical protein